MEEMAAAAPFTNRAFPDYGLMFPPPAETASSNSSGLGHRPAPFSAQLPTQLRKLRDPGRVRLIAGHGAGEPSECVERPFGIGEQVVGYEWAAYCGSRRLTAGF